MGSVCLRCLLEGFVLSKKKAKELVCRVQLVSARGDSPATQSGAFEILSQHPSVGVLERLRAREKARLTGGPVGSSHFMLSQSSVPPAQLLQAGRRATCAFETVQVAYCLVVCNHCATPTSLGSAGITGRHGLGGPLHLQHRRGRVKSCYETSKWGIGSVRRRTARRARGRPPREGDDRPEGDA